MTLCSGAVRIYGLLACTVLALTYWSEDLVL